MSIHEIWTMPNGEDPIGTELAADIQRTMGIAVDVEAAKVYRFEGITEQEAIRLTGVLVDPVTQVGLGNPILFDDKIVEVAYKPGVMNPEAESLMKAAHDLGIQPEAADSSWAYRFKTGVEGGQVQEIAARLLMNEKVQHIVTTKPDSLVFHGEPGPVQTVPIRKASLEQLTEISKDKLFLDDKEMTVIQDHFKSLDRDPTDAELEIIAARWSEHCGHKTFNARVLEVHGDGGVVEREPLFKRIRQEAERHFKGKVISAFEDNSGVIQFYEGMAICGKVETHNSPSAIEPYGGAMTGSGGVFRDIMGTGQGAKTVISTDMFCFAPPNLDSAMLPSGVLHHPDYLQRRVVQGVRDYGNRDGIPTANGSIHYHEDFRAKPTVIVGAYGLLPEFRAQKGEARIGDLVVILGGRTGRDGIHGATFSSGEMTERTATVNSSAVQIGNAIEEKRVFDALLEARDADLIRVLTDCGAAGFSSAVGEMGEETGVTVDISNAPLKYEGLAPWEIWLSESQERMVAAISPDNLETFIKICAKYNVEATVLGEFDGSNKLTVNYGDTRVAELDYEFLKNGLPQRAMYAHLQKEHIEERKPQTPETQLEWLKRLQAVLAHGNVQSKEPIVRQYDHGVQGGNIVSPFGGVTQEGPNDALVVRPLLNKPYGIVQSHGMNPILMRLDPVEGTRWAIAEAMANYVAVGGDAKQAALVENFIWPFPDTEAMGSLNASVDTIVEMMDELDIPVVSGKDSLSSTYRGNGEVIKIPPVLCMSVFGRIPDVEKTMTSYIKKPGKSWLYLVGTPSLNMGGSTYYDIAGGSSGEVPKIDTEILPAALEKMNDAIRDGKILACHDVSEGGVITAVAEMCFGSGTGTELHVPNEANAETFLFNETAGCFIVEVEGSQEMHEAFDGLPYQLLGKTKDSTDFDVTVGGYNPLFKTDIDTLKTAWQAPMKEIFH